MLLEFNVNGIPVQREVDETMPLLGMLREHLGLTGSKAGCGEGECGACTVLVDGQAVRSCITPVSSAAGKDVLTIEGLEQDGQLHPLQQAFLDAGAFQCGFCTPGMVMQGVALLNSCPNPTDAQIIEAMDGNICRCGTYRRVLRAVHVAAEISASAAGVR